MSGRKIQTLRFGGLLTSALALGAMPALAAAQTAESSQAPAQSTPAPPTEAAPTPSPQNDSSLGDIIVTAQKRSENLQRVPVSVTAITAQTAQAEGLRQIADLPAAVPSLVITPNFANVTTFLRGVGTDQISGGTESSIATYVDGVYIATLPGALFSFNNIERVEVLKGPQGTLFGRNATGGLINVVTRDPSWNPSLSGSIGYGNYDTFVGQAYGTTPVGDKIAIDAAVYYQNQGTGWGKNIYDGTDAYKDKNFSARSKQLFKPTDNFRLTLSEDYTDSQGNLSSSREPLPGAYGIGMTGYTGNFYDINYNSPSYQHFKGGGGSAKAELTTDPMKIMDLAAYRRSTFSNILDLDGTPLNATPTYQFYRNHYFSNEFQLQSPDGSPITWIGGLYYLTMFDQLDPLLQTGTGQAANGGSQTTTSEQQTASFAAFGQATVPITHNLHLTGGLRYTIDYRHFTGRVNNSVRGTFNEVDSRRTWRRASYRVALDYQVTPDVLLYASRSTGFKAGQYNPVNPTNPPANPEDLTAHEVGIKSQWFDNRLRFNVAGFYYDYRNIQLTQRIPSGLTQVLNASNAEIYGGEFSVVVRPVSALTLHGDLSLLSAHYKDFPNAPISLPSPAVCTPTPHSTGAPTGGNTSCTFDASGNVMERAPAATINVGGTYDINTGIGVVTLSGSYYHTSGSYFYPDNRLKQAPYDLVNAQLQLKRGHFAYRLWVKNLTGTKYYSYLYNSTGDMGAAGAPRTFGVAVDFQFN